MSALNDRLRALELPAPGSEETLLARYWAAIHRTNVTGLGSVEDYRLAFSSLAQKTRLWWCAQLPMFDVLHRRYQPVTGLPSLVHYPPGQPLPDKTKQDLQHMNDVVRASGTQVLEMRDSDHVDAAHYSVDGRQQFAVAYFALGTPDGNPIRQLAWESRGGTWHHSRYVLELAATEGMSRREFQQCRKLQMMSYLPPPEDPEVRGRVAGPPDSGGPERKPDAAPWISFADLTDLIEICLSPDSGSS